MERVDDDTSIVVMGVSGSGKSTVARALSRQFGFDYLDADWLHPPENVAKMSSGVALTDEDRWPWLRTVGERMQTQEASGRPVVVACSALKRAYRDLLREYAPGLFVVFLDGDATILQSRLDRRADGFITPSLLTSQLATLEPLEGDELGVRVVVDLGVTDLITVILTTLGAFGDP